MSDFLPSRGRKQKWLHCVLVLVFVFGFNYMSCVITISVLGHPLWCVLVLATFVIASVVYYSITALNCDEGLSSTLDDASVDKLINELKILETDKIPFVIDRFIQLDRKITGLDNTGTSEAERCVICMETRAAIQTLPCQHRVICAQCAWTVLKTALNQGSSHNCVVCRQEIRDFDGSLFKNLVNVKWEDIKEIVDDTKAI